MSSAPAVAVAAAASASSPSPSGVVTRTLYRHLLRLAALHDTRPSLKALLANPSYTWPSLSRDRPRVAQAADRFYGRGTRLYVDVKSLSGLVRQEFRQPQVEEQQTAAAATAARLSDGFFALRLLKDNAQRNNADDRLRFSDAILSVDPATPASLSAQQQLPAGWAVTPVLPSPDDLPASVPSSSWSGISSSLSSPSSASQRRRGPGRPRSRRSLLSQAEEVRLEPGILLVAHPCFVDDAFRGAVVLLTSHDEEGGTEGLVLNRPVGSLLKLDGAVDDIDRSIIQLYGSFSSMQHSLSGSHGVAAAPPLLFGGPVAGLRCLHRLSAFASVSRELVGGDWPVYAGELTFWERLHEVMERVRQERAAAAEHAHQPLPHAPTLAANTGDIALYFGRCVWSPGQLREELRQGMWMLTRGNGLHVFTQHKNFKLAGHSAAAAAAAAAAASASSSSSSSIPMPPPRSSSASPSASSALLPPSSLFASRYPPLSFPHERLWSHCVWQLGSEFRQFACMEPGKDSDRMGDADRSRRRDRLRQRRVEEDDAGGGRGGGGGGLP